MRSPESTNRRSVLRNFRSHTFARHHLPRPNETLVRWKEHHRALHVFAGIIVIRRKPAMLPRRGRCSSRRRGTNLATRAHDSISKRNRDLVVDKILFDCSISHTVVQILNQRITSDSYSYSQRCQSPINDGTRSASVTPVPVHVAAVPRGDAPPVLVLQKIVASCTIKHLIARVHALVTPESDGEITYRYAHHETLLLHDPYRCTRTLLPEVAGINAYRNANIETLLRTAAYM